mmetsp:Transcript_20344/g.50298  ORF Transcript_20344/g.50298 Transcript_20344/m.50298 type:complete len:96 (-) Transcript_20344:150-437(-)
MCERKKNTGWSAQTPTTNVVRPTSYSSSTTPASIFLSPTSRHRHNARWQELKIWRLRMGGPQTKSSSTTATASDTGTGFSGMANFDTLTKASRKP